MNVLTTGMRVQTNENFAGPEFAGMRGTISKVVPGAYSEGFGYLELEKPYRGANSAIVLPEDVDRLVEPEMPIVLHNVYGSTRYDGVKGTIVRVNVGAGLYQASIKAPWRSPDDCILLHAHEFTVVVEK